MKRQAADRPISLRRGAIQVALCAAAMLVLVGGCGQFNDDPAAGGLAVQVGFDGQQQPNGSLPQDITFTGPGEAVVQIVVGAIVITHQRNPPNPIEPYTAADQVNDNNRELLEQDALQSVVYLELINLPHTGDTVEFEIPPNNAGSWQLIAVGLRNQRASLNNVTNDDPAWYGFFPQFLNGQVPPGEEVPQPLILQPGCNLATPPAGAGCP